MDTILIIALWVAIAGFMWAADKAGLFDTDGVDPDDSQW